MPVVNLFRDLPLHDDEGNVRVVVEVPAGSNLKLKYDPNLNLFVWSRELSLGIAYPYDFGFLPQTLADDGDALDALVYSDNGSHPGVVVPGRAIGALRVEQQRDGGPPRRNDRIVVIPIHDHRNGTLTDASQLPARVLDELEAFFRASLVLTGKRIKLLGWADAREAREIVEQAAQSFQAG